MKILFYDPATPLAYDATTPAVQALGGTEATTIRLAQALKNHHSVYVAQPCRETAANLNCDGVNYISFETAGTLSPDVVILSRLYRKLEEVAKLFPQARRYLWLHNMPSRELHGARAMLEKYHYQIIAVSEFHRVALERRLRGKWFQRRPSFLHKTQPAYPPIQVIYNPIDDGLQPDQTPIHAEQLLFMSSPHKGLAETLKLFAGVQQVFPEYQLLIANPGYNQMALQLPKQARFLGALPHPQVIQQLRQAFCVFYPQTARVETFGLVYAEANAVGTPVLAHGAGAAREVLSSKEQLVNGRRLAAVIDKLEEWRQKRPVLRGREEFRLSVVVRRWLEVFSM